MTLMGTNLVIPDTIGLEALIGSGSRFRAILAQAFFFESTLKALDKRLEVGSPGRQDIHRTADAQQESGEGRWKAIRGLVPDKTRVTVITDTAWYTTFLKSSRHR